MPHKQLGEAAPDHVQAEDSGGEDKQEEGAVVALKGEGVGFRSEQSDVLTSKHAKATSDP